MIFGVCTTRLCCVCADGVVTREDMQTLKNDWLTDNVRLSYQYRLI